MFHFVFDSFVWALNNNEATEPNTIILTTEKESSKLEQSMENECKHVHRTYMKYRSLLGPIEKVNTQIDLTIDLVVPMEILMEKMKIINTISFF